VKKGAMTPQAYYSTTGDWRGYGGQFEAPPTLKVEDGEVLAVDGRSAYRLFADRWGAFLLNEPDADPKPAGKPPRAELALHMDGFRLTDKSFTAGDILKLSMTGFPWSREDAPPTASVHTGSTIYFTHPLSFQVYIIGLPGQGHEKGDSRR
jgi:hypothetical protein